MLRMKSLVSEKAKIGKNVTIGDFSIIGDDVEIGDDTVIASHVVVDGHTKIGANCKLHPFSVVGGPPQHKLHDSSVVPKLVVGDGCTFREHVTINAGSSVGISRRCEDAALTSIGSNCLFLASSHVGHDCRIGNDVIISNGSLLAGHVCVGDGATVGGGATIRQFVNVGRMSMIGGSTAVDGHVAPFGLVSGNRAKFRGPNLVGLRRRSISLGTIRQLQHVFFHLFKIDRDPMSSTLSDRARCILEMNRNNEFVKSVCNFALHKEFFEMGKSVPEYDWGPRQKKVGFTFFEK